MAQPVSKAPFTVQTNQPGGRSGSKVKTKPGPARSDGRIRSNPTKSGGINRPTKGGPTSYK